jgi:hypothetical protein
MLTSIQSMKFFQHIGRGDSNTYMGGRSESNPLQGLCQANGCAPACWLMLISTIMVCYKKAGYGSSIVSPMSGVSIEFMGNIYVVDSNLLVFLADEFDCGKLMQLAQKSLDAWAGFLNATGGALNPNKCYWYLVPYTCANSEWRYDRQTNFTLTIPLPDGARAEIQQTNIDEAKKMLGVWSTPSGNDTRHLEECIIAKTRTWMEQIKNSTLPTHLVWRVYRYQLWPRLRYGLGTLATRNAATSSLLHGLEFEMVSSMGVNKHVKVEWRTIAREFRGIGHFSLPVEQFICWLEMILQHCQAGCTVSSKLRATLEALQLELGCRGNPMNKNFSLQGRLTTDA